jgi:hypothetical protein
MNEDAELVKKAKARAKHQLRMDKLGRVGHRAGIKAGPTTSRRSAKRIRIRQRESETLELRLRNFSYQQISQHTKVSVAQCERDLTSALSRIVPFETAQKVLQLEVTRLDEMAAGHFDNACQGDIAASHVMLRLIEMRCRLYGLLDRDRAGAAARLVISEGNGDQQRSMSVEFILPGHKTAVDLGSLSSRSPQQPVSPVQHEHHTQQPNQPVRIEPRADDVVIERITPPTSAWDQHGRYGWMKG